MRRMVMMANSVDSTTELCKTIDAGFLRTDNPVQSTY
jgi:hypothetical protein